MKRSIAVKHFNKLFDATFNDAITFISGKSGDTGIADNVLHDTYTEVFRYILRQKEYDEQDVGKKFLKTLKITVERYTRSVDKTDDQEYISDADKLNTLVMTELELSEQQAMDDLYVKKAQSYVLQKGLKERKAFILYFYEGYSADDIARMLSISDKEVYGFLEKTVSGIQNNFLSKYISK